MTSTDLITKQVSQLDTNAYIKMGNEFVNARYTLTLKQHKALLIILSQFTGNETIKIDFKEFAKALNIGTNTGYTSKIEKIIQAIGARYITIDSRSANTEEEVQKYSIIFFSEIIRPGDGTIEITLPKKLLPYFTELNKQYTTLQLKVQLDFNSIYAIRIYQLIKQFESTGYRKIHIDELRNILDLNNRYSKIHDFKRYVLEPAAKEINEKSQFVLEYRVDGQQGRNKTKYIEFIFAKKFHTLKQTKETIDLQHALTQIGVNNDLVELLFDTYDYERILRNFEYVIKQNLEKTKDIASYIVSAIKKDYAENSKMEFDPLTKFNNISNDDLKNIIRNVHPRFTNFENQIFKQYTNVEQIKNSPIAMSIIKKYLR